MHVRLSTCRGLSVLEEGTQDFCGWISDVLFHPETGRIEGIMIRGGGITGEGFLLREDIVRWGKYLWIRSANTIGPLEDIVRLRKLAADSRRILGQRVQTESGLYLGKCADIQFSTVSWDIEWIFPRKFFFFWGIAIPRSSIIEVTAKAIIVRDPVLSQTERTQEAKETVRLEELVEVPRLS